MKERDSGMRILMLAVTLAVLAYFGFQALRYLLDPLATTLAYAYQVEETVELNGYLVREEQVLGHEDSSFLRLQRAEGERVSAGGTVAVVYADQGSLDRQNEIDNLTGRIEQLEYAKESMLGVEASLKLDNQIMQSMLDYRADLAANRLDRAEDHGQDLRALVLKRDYAYSDSKDLDVLLEELVAERAALRKAAAGSVRKITSPQSGLYSAVVDGYEVVLTPERAAEMLPSELSALQADGNVRSSVGKIILDDWWYYAAVLPAEQAQELAEQSETLLERGQHLTMRFAKSVEWDLEADVWAVGPEENGKCVVVLRGSTHLPQLTLLRAQSAEVIVSAVTGVRVPKEAVRVVTHTVTDENGTQRTEQITGVYCVVGAKAAFKEAEVLHSDRDFVLLEAAPAAEKNRLRLGDEVIVTAKNLYDGKVVG